MHFAMYFPWLSARGGAERVMLEVMTRSRHRWTLYTHHRELESTYPGFAACDVVELSPGIDPRRSFALFATAAVTIARTLLPGEHDGLLVSSEGLGDLVTTRNRLPAACFCHTPLKIVYDERTRRELVVHNPRLRAALTVLGPAFAAVDRRAWRRYRHVLANSEQTVRRIAAAGLRPGGPLEVLHPGVDASRFVAGPEHRPPTFLVAGRITWAKHVELAVDAFADPAVRSSPAELVVAGATGGPGDEYLADLRRRADGLAVRFELDPSDERLAELYRTATAVLFTPAEEDWGMVPLEAMASGTPVIASAGGGALESVVDGVTGWLVAPEAPAFAARVLDALGADLAPLRAAARQRALGFDWARFVARVDDVMAGVAGGGAQP
ncbi:MAG: glycosyltransferase [Acidimicrobiales bacterium]